MSVSYHTVAEHEAGQRIDNFLFRQFRKVPKSVIYRVLRKGEVRIDRKRVGPEHRLLTGESIRIPPLARETGAENAAGPVETLSASLRTRLEQAILLEDEQLIVLNKPAGLPVHGGSGISTGLIEAFRQLRPNLPFVELAHRLDRDTSGLILLAKSRPALTELHRLLREGGMNKHYLALSAGQWQGEARQISLDLKRVGNQARKVQVADATEDGRTAESIFTPLQRGPDCTLLDVQILTGRMHQIRVQLAHLGHPVLGDERYGDFGLNRVWRRQGLKRLFLHAASLVFMFEPTGQRYRLEAPLPPELERVLQPLKSATRGRQE
ncbi:MAG: RluA family pseudouridine synthase [Thiothrix sp.]|nr:RluA family pseudouridine synthase [Thiothrix sp.]HPQ94439.1 RluA family pseudouridine synthase [Thiolinea sp.]